MLQCFRQHAEIRNACREIERAQAGEKFGAGAAGEQRDLALVEPGPGGVLGRGEAVPVLRNNVVLH